MTDEKRPASPERHRSLGSGPEPETLPVPPALQPLESYSEKSREILDDDKSLSRKSTETAHDDSSSEDASIEFEEDEERVRERERPRQRMTRSISEVRDGIQSLRDAELGDALEKEPTQPSDRDPNLVTWAYPYDPENPKTWTFKKKWAAVLIGKSICSGRRSLSTVTKSAPSVMLYSLLSCVFVNDCSGFG